MPMVTIVMTQQNLYLMRVISQKLMIQMTKRLNGRVLNLAKQKVFNKIPLKTQIQRDQTIKTKQINLSKRL